MQQTLNLIFRRTLIYSINITNFYRDTRTKFELWNCRGQTKTDGLLHTECMLFPATDQLHLKCLYLFKKIYYTTSVMRKSNHQFPLNRCWRKHLIRLEEKDFIISAFYVNYIKFYIIILIIVLIKRILSKSQYKMYTKLYKKYIKNSISLPNLY